MTDLTNVAAVAVAFFAFVWGAVVHVRDARTRKYAEQAERAGHLIELMRGIDLGGADTGLERAAARARHDKQLRDLQRVVRISAAQFSARALRPTTSRLVILAFAGYGLFFLIDGAALSLSALHIHGSAKVAALLIGGAVGVLGIAGLTAGGVLGHRRSQSRSRQKDAGVTLTTLSEEIRRDVAAFRTWLTVRKLNRTRLRDIRPIPPEDPTT